MNRAYPSEWVSDGWHHGVCTCSRYKLMEIHFLKPTVPLCCRLLKVEIWWDLPSEIWSNPQLSFVWARWNGSDLEGLTQSSRMLLIGVCCWSLLSHKKKIDSVTCCLKCTQSRPCVALLQWPLGLILNLPHTQRASMTNPAPLSPACTWFPEDKSKQCRKLGLMVTCCLLFYKAFLISRVCVNSLLAGTKTEDSLMIVFQDIAS